MTLTRTIASSAVIAVMLGRTALGMPNVGTAFPSFAAKDLTGQAHQSNEYVGSRTLVVSISDRDGGEAMRAWYAAADANMAPTIARRSLLSISLPFFVTTDFARSQAREQVPEQFWHDTLLDRGEISERLGQTKSNVPYVYALDEQGDVLAAVHARVDSTEAQRIWRALAPR